MTRPANKAEKAAELTYTRIAQAFVSSWTNCEPNLIAGSCAIYRLQDEIKAEGELEFADHHYRPLISPQCYQIAAADLAFHRETLRFKEALHRHIKGGLGFGLGLGHGGKIRPRELRKC